MGEEAFVGPAEAAGQVAQAIRVLCEPNGFLFVKAGDKADGFEQFSSRSRISDTLIYKDSARR